MKHTSLLTCKCGGNRPQAYRHRPVEHVVVSHALGQTGEWERYHSLSTTETTCTDPCTREVADGHPYLIVLHVFFIVTGLGGATGVWLKEVVSSMRTANDVWRIM